MKIKLTSIIVMQFFYTIVLHGQISIPITPKGWLINETELIIKKFDFSEQEANGLMQNFQEVSKHEPVTGVGINTKIDVKNITWNCDEDSSCILRIKFTSRNAEGFKFDFSNFYLPEKTYLFFYDSNKDRLLGAFSNLNNRDDGFFSTAIIEGNEIVIEVNSHQSFIKNVNFNIYRTGIIYTSNSHAGLSLNCHNDVQCQPWASTMCNQIRSVVKIGFWDERYDPPLFNSCSGVLLDNFDENGIRSFIPYIFTANHCIENSADLNSIVIYFNFQRPTCFTSGVFFNDQNTLTGIVKEHGPFASAWCEDLAIIKPVENIPLQYNVFYSGWKKYSKHKELEDDNATTGTVIHHPHGDIKKVTEGEIKKHTQGFPTWTEYPCFTFDPTSGILETGSSGSPLFVHNKYVIGVLTGYTHGTGPANCTNVPEWLFSNNGHGDVWSQLIEYLSPNIPLASSEGVDPMQICQSVVNLWGFFYPASDWQSKNDITIQAQQQIVLAANNIPTLITSSPVAMQGNFADYTFRSGNNIKILPGFKIESGNRMLATIGSCQAFSGCGFNSNFKIVGDNNSNNDFVYSDGVLGQVGVERIKVYPNPADDILHIEHNRISLSFIIFDLTGRRIIESLLSHENIIDISNLSTGLYTIKIIDNEGGVIDYHKFIKN